MLGKQYTSLKLGISTANHFSFKASLSARPLVNHSFLAREYKSMRSIHKLLFRLGGSFLARE